MPPFSRNITWNEFSVKEKFASFLSLFLSFLTDMAHYKCSLLLFLLLLLSMLNSEHIKIV